MGALDFFSNSGFSGEFLPRCEFKKDDAESKSFLVEFLFGIDEMKTFYKHSTQVAGKWVFEACTMDDSCPACKAQINRSGVAATLVRNLDDETIMTLEISGPEFRTLKAVLSEVKSDIQSKMKKKGATQEEIDAVEVDLPGRAFKRGFKLTPVAGKAPRKEMLWYAKDLLEEDEIFNGEIPNWDYVGRPKSIDKIKERFGLSTVANVDNTRPDSAF